MTRWYSVYKAASGKIRLLKRGTSEETDLEIGLPPSVEPSLDSSFFHKMELEDIEPVLTKGKFHELAELNPKKQLLVGLEEDNNYRAWLINREGPLSR